MGTFNNYVHRPNFDHLLTSSGQTWTFYILSIYNLLHDPRVLSTYHLPNSPTVLVHVVIECPLLRHSFCRDNGYLMENEKKMLHSNENQSVS